MSETVKDAPKIAMLPPTLLLVFICAGITLDWIFPVNFGHLWGGFGLILLISAFSLTIWAKKCFENAETNVAPNKPATTIVTDGPFQYTRNPMYLSFMIGFAGLGMMADAPLMLLLLFPLFYMLNNKTIIPEEAYLTEKFGDTYTEYQSRVNRWIPLPK